MFFVINFEIFKANKSEIKIWILLIFDSMTTIALPKLKFYLEKVLLSPLPKLGRVCEELGESFIHNIPFNLLLSFGVKKFCRIVCSWGK